MHAKEERVLRPVPGREARLTHPGCRTTLIILAVAWAARALAILLFSSCAEATAMARCTAGAAPPLPLVSVIIPCHNAMPWLDACLASCATQDYEGPLEVSIFDDSSTDGSDACIRAWAGRLEDAGVRCVCSGNRWPGSDGNGVTDPTAPAGGAGRARNKAVAQSSGSFLCFLDADDVMLPGRVRRQLAAAREHPCAIIGGGFVKEPPGATEHYAKWYAARNAGIHAFVSAGRWWSIPTPPIHCHLTSLCPRASASRANGLTDTQLWLQHFRELTVLMPTWFFSRAVFDRVGAFVEADPTAEGEAEDLIFFHAHIAGELARLAATPSTTPLPTHATASTQDGMGCDAAARWEKPTRLASEDARLERRGQLQLSMGSLYSSHASASSSTATGASLDAGEGETGGAASSGEGGRWEERAAPQFLVRAGEGCQA